jgi:RNA methyltransferase, TrmH family
MKNALLQTPRVHQIERATHPVIRAFRRALASGLSPEGWVAIEGPVLFREALAAGGHGVRIHSVLFTERGRSRLGEELHTLPSDAEVTLTSELVYSRATQTETPRGIAALVELPARDLDDVLKRPDALLLIACGVQDPGNLGTIMRSAHALGGSALLALRETVSPFNPKAVRSSAGAVFRIPVFAGIDWDALFARLRGARVSLVAAERRSSTSLRDADLRGRVGILIGQEAAGLNGQVIQAADLHLAIPIRADTDSLNAASAATIFLYEAARQRGFAFHESV